MGRCYSMDLRERVTAFVAQGHSRRAAARRLGVSGSFAIKLVKHQKRSGSPAPMRQGRPPGTGKLAPFQAFLVGEVEKKPDITMPELAARLMKEHGITATPAALSRLLCRNGFTYKKARWRRNAHAPTFGMSVVSGRARVRPGCASSHTGWCFSTRPSSTPR